MIHRIRTVTATLVWASLVTLTSASALAGGEPDAARDTSGIRVRYGDLDLSKPRDVANLYRRIKRAADTICGSPSSWGGRLSSVETCKQKTIEDAVGRINRPQLSAFYRDHGSRRMAQR